MSDRYADRACTADDFDAFYDEERWPEANRLCNVCPIRSRCLKDALREEGSVGPGHRYGFRAGKTPDERHKLFKSSKV